MAQPKVRAHHLTVIGSNSQRPSYHKKLNVNGFVNWMQKSEGILANVTRGVCEFYDDLLFSIKRNHEIQASIMRRHEMAQHQLDSLEITCLSIAALCFVGLVGMGVWFLHL